MQTQIKIALIGDYSASVTAHVAIPKSLELTAEKLNIKLDYTWLATDKLSGKINALLTDYDGIWCVPASPYQNTEGALAAIGWAREQQVPFLGTCGGYQHAILEYAKNALGHVEADNIESNPNAAMPLIAPLACALIEKSGEILLRPKTKIRTICGHDKIEELYHCSFGFNPEYLPLFKSSDLIISAFDRADEPKAVELKNHPFFIGTAFQPERAGLRNEIHPLIAAFIKAATNTEKGK